MGLCLSVRCSISLCLQARCVYPTNWVLHIFALLLPLRSCITYYTNSYMYVLCIRVILAMLAIVYLVQCNTKTCYSCNGIHVTVVTITSLVPCIVSVSIECCYLINLRTLEISQYYNFNCLVTFVMQVNMIQDLLSV